MNDRDKPELEQANEKKFKARKQRFFWACFHRR